MQYNPINWSRAKLVCHLLVCRINVGLVESMIKQWSGQIECALYWTQNMEHSFSILLLFRTPSIWAEQYWFAEYFHFEIQTDWQCIGSDAETALDRFLARALNTDEWSPKYSVVCLHENVFVWLVFGILVQFIWKKPMQLLNLVRMCRFFKLRPNEKSILSKFVFISAVNFALDANLLKAIWRGLFFVFNFVLESTIQRGTAEKSIQVDIWTYVTPRIYAKKCKLRSNTRYYYCSVFVIEFRSCTGTHTLHTYFA